MKNDNTEYYTTVIVEYYLTTLPTPAITVSLGQVTGRTTKAIWRNHETIRQEGKNNKSTEWTHETSNNTATVVSYTQLKQVWQDEFHVSSKSKSEQQPNENKPNIFASSQGRASSSSNRPAIAFTKNTMVCVCGYYICLCSPFLLGMVCGRLWKGDRSENKKTKKTKEKQEKQEKSRDGLTP